MMSFLKALKHTFQNDSVTNELIGIVILNPNDIRVHKIKPNTTYENFHKTDNIEITFNKPLHLDNKLIPLENKQVMTFHPDILYTNGEKTLIVKEKTSKYLFDKANFTLCEIDMIDFITNESITVLVQDLTIKGYLL